MMMMMMMNHTQNLFIRVFGVSNDQRRKGLRVSIRASLVITQLSAYIWLLFWNHVTFGPLVFGVRSPTFRPSVVA